MFLRRSKLLGAYVLLVLLASGCGTTSTTTVAKYQTTKTMTSAESTSNSPKSTETNGPSSNSQSTAAPLPSQSTPTSTQVNGTLQVHYIDVGQADSILIKVSDGTAVLIDGGNNPDGPSVVNYLKSQQVKELSAVIATHPHEDHIGGLDTVIKSFPVKAVYMPNASATTKTFGDFISAVTASGAKRTRLRRVLP